MQIVEAASDNGLGNIYVGLTHGYDDQGDLRYWGTGKVFDSHGSPWNGWSWWSGDDCFVANQDILASVTCNDRYYALCEIEYAVC